MSTKMVRVSDLTDVLLRSLPCAFANSFSPSDVLLIDGLTKRFRLPGWRIAWIVGPKEFVDALGSAGSYLDGGANVPFQKPPSPCWSPPSSAPR